MGEHRRSRQDSGTLRRCSYLSAGSPSPSQRLRQYLAVSRQAEELDDFCAERSGKLLQHTASVSSILEQHHRPRIEGCGDLPKRDDRHVLQPTLHAADVSAIDADLLRDGRLTQTRAQTKTAKVPSKNLAYIHPQSETASRILMRRIIILASPSVGSNYRVRNLYREIKNAQR